MSGVLVTNIQRFSLHDGPGIRTTVFLKGCSICCPWCSNPENIIPKIQEYKVGARTNVYGKWYTAEELLQECLKDRKFYGGNLLSLKEWSVDRYDQLALLPGGVTFSGGESLLQMPAMTALCESLHNENIHIAIETSLYAPTENIEMSLPYIDLYYVDIKILSPQVCKSVEHADVNVFLSNFECLLSWSNDKGQHKPVVIRIPVIGTHTDSDEHFSDVIELLTKYKQRVLKIELIKEHNLAESKYQSLNLVPNYHGVDDSKMISFKVRLETTLGIPVEICKV